LRLPSNNLLLFLPNGSQSAQKSVRTAFHLLLATRLVVIRPRDQLPVRGNAHFVSKIAHEAKKVVGQVVPDRVRVGHNKLLYAHEQSALALANRVRVRRPHDGGPGRPERPGRPRRLVEARCLYSRCRSHFGPRHMALRHGYGNGLGCDRDRE
jgi:hypothetical protein